MRSPRISARMKRRNRRKAKRLTFDFLKRWPVILEEWRREDLLALGRSVGKTP